MSLESGFQNLSVTDGTSFTNFFDGEDGGNFSAVAGEEFYSPDVAFEMFGEPGDFTEVVEPVRNDNETFMNMTIGTYMAAGSADPEQLVSSKLNTSKMMSPPFKKSLEALPESLSSTQQPNSSQMANLDEEKNQDLASWLLVSTDESLPHALPDYLKDFRKERSPTPEESLPHFPPVSLVSVTDPETSSSVDSVEEKSQDTDYTFSEIHKMISAEAMTSSNATLLLEAMKKNKKKMSGQNNENSADKVGQDHQLSRHESKTSKDVSGLFSSSSESKLQDWKQASILPNLSREVPPFASKSDGNFTSADPPMVPNDGGEKYTMAEKNQSASPEADLMSYLLLSDSQSLGLSSRDESKMMPSLLPETSSMTFLQDSLQAPKDFLASTPLVGQQRLFPMFSTMTPLDQHSIYHIVSPSKCSPAINLPEKVQIADVCCVMLGQRTQFPVTNKHKRGVKCTFNIRKATLDGNPINPDCSPFEVKQQVTLQPASEEQVEVLFTPKDQGLFWASMTVFAQSLADLSEYHTYTVILEGKAEFPLLQVSPKSELLDFGDVIWGHAAYRSFKIQNIGKATVPVRFSIFRTESSLCSFSFCSDQCPDISNISHTAKPEGATSVMSMSLPGLRQGEAVQTHVVKVCCQVKDIQNAEGKYGQPCEKFQAVLSIDVDVPLSHRSHLSQIRMVVTAGMVKLHTDKDTCNLYCLPGEVKKEAIKIINSGNIPMEVGLHLEPPLPCFALHATRMLLHPHVHQLAHVEYRPQLSKNSADEATLVLFDQLCKYHIPVQGSTKLTRSKINASATSIPFGGVDIGKEAMQKFTFVADRDAMLKIYIRDGNGIFQLINEDGKVDEVMQLRAKEQVKYTVKILFRPKNVRFYSQLLVVQVLNSNRFTVPLYGYGGQSLITVTQVKTTDKGENLLDLGHITQGSPVIRNIRVTNDGVRNAHIATTAIDTNRKEMSPHKASLMPSRLTLEPNESKELVLIYHPSEAEMELCVSGRALVAVIRLLCVDELARQRALRTDTTVAKVHAIDFDIPQTLQDKEKPDAEAIAALPLNPQGKLFKMSLKSMKIGLLAQTFPPEKLPQHGLSPVIVDSKQGCRKSPSARIALQPVNQNLGNGGVASKDKDVWSVNPVDLQFTVLNSKSKEFAQIINFSNTDLRFTVECDDVLQVKPSQGTVPSRNWTQCEIHLSDNYWRRNEQAVSGLIKIFCAQQTQYIRVQVIPSPPSVLSPAAMSAKPSDAGHLDMGTTSGAVGIHAANEVVVPPASVGSTSEINYVFRNTSSVCMVWSVTPCQPANLQISSDDKYQSIAESVFKLTPTYGNIKSGAVQTLKLEFSPETDGLHSQVWVIRVAPGQGPHRFTVHGQGCKASPSESAVEQASSGKSGRETTVSKLPKWVPVSSKGEKQDQDKSTRASQGKATAERSSSSKGSSIHKGGEKLVGIVFLEKSHLHFGPVGPGDKQVLELNVINSMDRDAEMTVELEPGPPFSIRRAHFNIGKTRMIRFPITFKPTTIAKFQRKIVMREKKSLRVLTATIDGDCVS